MHFAVNTFMWTSRFREQHLPLLEKLREWGADGVEIANSDFDGFPAQAIRRELEVLGLSCTLSASPPAVEMSMIHDDPIVRSAAVAYIRTALQVAAELGAASLVGPLYARVGWFTGARPNDDQFGWAVDALQSLIADLERLDVSLALEMMNRYESFFLPTAADGVRLCEAVGSERIGLLLDTAHMVIEEKDPIAALRTAGRWLLHVQTSENDRGTPGTGRVVDWPALFRTLREIGYRGGCAIESFPFQDPVGGAATWCWRDLAPSPDAIARDGLSFLRRTCEEAER